METITDKNLVCYFGWGRREYIEKCFPALLKAIRPQDRLLVVDQEMYNFDYYIQFKDQIDYLVGFKQNYRIGPAWEFFKYLACWLKTVKQDNVKWSPDFINIVESDALVGRKFIEKLMPLFDDKTAIVTGYLGLDDKNTNINERDGEVYIKSGTQGVNVIVKTKDFLEISDYPNYTQDFYFQEKMKDKGIIKCLDLVKHIGINGKSKGFIK